MNLKIVSKAEQEYQAAVRCTASGGGCRGLAGVLRAVNKSREQFDRDVKALARKIEAGIVEPMRIRAVPPRKGE